MTLSKAAFTVALVVMLAPSVWAGETPEAAAQRSAEAWLKLVDGAKYEDAWRQAASAVKKAVTTEQWQQGVSAERHPLGKLLSRKLKTRLYTEQLPEAPSGKQVIIQFAATFESKASAEEQVTLVLDPDGTWRVWTYFIR